MGGRSRAAAQLLSGQGFKEVYNLSGGIKAWQGATTSGPAEHGMASITGDEKPVEMLAIVYGMEEGMRSFYEELARRVGSENEPLTSLFGKLSDVEVEHKKLLADIFNERFPEEAAAKPLEDRAESTAAEGGVSTSELLETYGVDVKSAEDLLTLAMALETQALDLYMRYAQRSADPETKAVLHELADEEKAHLGSLGELLEKSAS